METIKGRIKAISVSKERGTQKTNVPRAELKADFGIIGDAHSGDWHRQVSLLGIESINGWTAIIITVLFVNVLQSISDYLVPYMLIKPIQVGIPNLIQW